MIEGKIYCYYVNNKYYVGKTYTKDKKRQKDHKYCAYVRKDQNPFQRAIRKYGWDNVLKTYKVLEVLYDNDKQTLNNKLIEREMFWIKELNSLVPNGYNVLFSNHYKIPENKNKEETYRKISEKLKGKNNNPLTSDRIICVETGVIYPSVREAERINNYPKNVLCKALSGRQKTSKGFHWKYLDKENFEYSVEKGRKEPLVEKHSQKIEVICLETGKIYESINDCAREMFGNKNFKTRISNSCKHNKPYKNYNFKFINNGYPVPSLNED